MRGCNNDQITFLKAAAKRLIKRSRSMKHLVRIKKRVTTIATLTKKEANDSVVLEYN